MNVTLKSNGKTLKAPADLATLFYIAFNPSTASAMVAGEDRGMAVKVLQSKVMPALGKIDSVIVQWTDGASKEHTVMVDGEVINTHLTKIESAVSKNSAFRASVVEENQSYGVGRQELVTGGSDKTRASGESKYANLADAGLAALLA